MTPGIEAVSAAVTVASGVGYWKENAYPLRHYSWWLWHVIAPLATTLFHYFPGRRLHMVGDLPRGVMDQWSRWCKDPEYAVGVECIRAAWFLRKRAPRHASTFAAGRRPGAHRALRLLPRGVWPSPLADVARVGSRRDLRTHNHSCNTGSRLIETAPLACV